jgi:hypothetical protein
MPISTSVLAGTIWGPPELNSYGPLWHEKPIANLGGHTLVFEGRFDLPLLTASSHSIEAQILASQGRLDEALAEARAAVEMAPQRMQAHLKRAWSIAKQSAWRKWEKHDTTESQFTRPAKVLRHSTPLADIFLVRTLLIVAT